MLLLAWPVALVIWANGKLEHVDALSDRAATPATTYLIAGSDGRDGSFDDNETEGARTDTVMILTKPKRGTTSLVSIPRDTVIEIDGRKMKLNAAYTAGGPSTLVEAVEDLTGITIDHYVEVGMMGVENVVNAVGGINLCWDADVDDHWSGMVWSAGCHDVDGTQALAFSRMRKADPTGDIGRGLRQRLVIQGVLAKLKGPSVLMPWTQIRLINAVTSNVVTDRDTGILDLARMALAFRDATGTRGYEGAPPIANADYRGDGIGSTVLLDPEQAPVFWQQVMDGTLPTQTERDESEGGTT